MIDPVFAPAERCRTARETHGDAVLRADPVGARQGGRMNQNFQINYMFSGIDFIT